LSIDKEFEVFAKRFRELHVAGKVNIKSKLQDIAFPEKTSIYTPNHKVKTKGVVKMSRPTTFMRSTKRIPSYFEHVDFLHSQHDSCASKNLMKEAYQKLYQQNVLVSLKIAFLHLTLFLNCTCRQEQISG